MSDISNQDLLWEKQAPARVKKAEPAKPEPAKKPAAKKAPAKKN
jgi:topoisomerase IA-like protein